MSEQAEGAPFGVNDEDWHVVVNGRANVLIVGPELTTAQVVDVMRRSFAAPIGRWEPGGAAAASACQTLLVEDAHRLTLGEQQQLDGCLVTLAQPQVVTTASEPLFPLVEQGKFLASLYYRLNVVYLLFEAIGGPGH